MIKGIYKRLLLSLGPILVALIFVSWSSAAASDAAVGNSAVGNSAVGNSAVGNSAVGNSAVGNFIVEYPIPVANSQPRNIIAEAPGRVWFTMTAANEIGRLVVTAPNNYQFTTYPVPTANSDPYDLLFDGKYIWFTEHDGNKIGRLDPTDGNIIEHPIPTANSSPTGIALAPNGDIWFVEQTANKLGQFTPGNGQFNEFPLKTGNALPHDIAIADSNTIWITEPGINRAGRFTINTQTWLETPTGTTGLPPWPTDSIVTDQTGRPWASAPAKGQIGRYSPGTLALWRWANTASAAVQPTDLAYRAQDGLHQFWHVSPDNGFVGVLITNEQGEAVAARSRPLPSASSIPLGIALDTDGHVWITESGSNNIAEWSPPYFYFGYQPIILR